MATEAVRELIRLGPFKGLDTTTADLYLPPGYATIAENVNSWRFPGAFTTPKGRTNVGTVRFTNASPFSVYALAAYYPDDSTQRFIVSPSTPLANTFTGTGIFDMESGLTAPVTFGTTTPAGLGAFDQGVQMGNAVYLNNGLQYSDANPGKAYYWQAPAPTFLQSYTVTAQTASPVMPAGTYIYAFTWNVCRPGLSDDFTMGQETNPYGDEPSGLTYMYQAAVDGVTQNILISGTFTGTLPDGSTYYTRIYRQSYNQPFWSLVVDLTDSSVSSYVDYASDESIAGNTPLADSRWAPPNVLLAAPSYQPTMMQAWPIESHKNRMWMFTAVPDTRNTTTTLENDVPQLQLWYSNYGRPWEFDAVEQVLLVEDEDTPNFPYTQTTNCFRIQGSTYGEWPVALASMGGLLCVFKRQSMWIIIGDDQNTFTPQKVAQIGCIARHSVTKTPGAVYWLSEQGAYFYDGNGPQYISEKIRGTLEKYEASLGGAVGFYSNLTWYLSIPGALGVTFAYYIPAREWYQLPYFTPAAYYSPASPQTAGSTKNNQVLAVRDVDQSKLDVWFVDNTDLGESVTGTWAGPLTDSGLPAEQKSYEYITVLAPYQANAVATATLTVDPGMPTQSITTYTIPLDEGETRHVVRVSDPDSGGNAPLGYLAKLQVTGTSPGTITTPVTIYSAAVWGTAFRKLTLQT